MRNHIRIINLIIALFFCIGYQPFFAQDLLHLDGADISLIDGATIHVEGGVVLNNGSQFDKNGDVYIGSYGSGYFPTSADWVLNHLENPGINLDANVQIHFAGQGMVQEMRGQGNPVFNTLFVSNHTRINKAVSIKNTLYLNTGVLELNGNDLFIERGLPNAIQYTGNGGRILADTHPEQDGAYGFVIWDVNGSQSNQFFTVPFSNKDGEMIPSSVLLNGTGRDVIKFSTYPTDLSNKPYPVQTGISTNVQTMEDQGGRDWAERFVDRFWIINGGRNQIRRMRLSYANSDISGEVSGKESKLKAQFWDQSFWNFLNKGIMQNARVLEWADLPIPSGVWGISLQNDPTHVQDPLIISSLSLYPNPASSFFKLDMGLTTPQLATLELYTIDGKLVKRLSSHKSLLHQWSIDISKFSQGMYLLKIQTETASTYRRLEVI